MRQCTSSRTEYPSDVSYPTAPTDFNDPKGAVVGLAQKIVKIAPNVFLAWSGILADVIPMVEFLRYEVRRGRIDLDNLKKMFGDFLELQHERLSRLQLALIFNEPDRWTIWQKDCVAAEMPGFGSIITLGSGTGHMEEHLKAHPLPPPPEQKDYKFPEDAHKVAYLLQYIVGAMAQQRVEGFGLDQAWGGGFEILLRKDGINLDKVDRVLFHSQFWGESETGDVWTSQIGKRFFQFYQGDELVILSQAKGEITQAHVVSPPDKKINPENGQPEINHTVPQLVCTHLVQHETGLERVILSYNDMGHDWCGLGNLDGLGLSIRVNTDHLQRLIGQNKTTPRDVK